MYCRNCYKMIDDGSTFCPHCGQNQHGQTKKAGAGRNVLVIILCVFGALFILGAIGSAFDNEPHKVGTADTYSTEVTTPTKNEFTVGDIVELNGVRVTLNSVKESSGNDLFAPEPGTVFLICEFTIENYSASDISVSSLMCFEAYIDDYATNMDMSATVSSDKHQLDGTVASGKKMNGVIGYQAPSNWSEIEIRFTPDFWADQDIIFAYTR